MIIMSGSHVLLKVIACSLLLRINQTWFIIYMTGDQGIYFLYKLLRGDSRYAFRLPNLLSWIASGICRVGIKTVVDFTLLIHYRHPFDLGGMYWSINLVLNQIFCFVSVYLYQRFVVDHSSDDRHNNSTSIANAAILCNSTDTEKNTAGCDRDELPLLPLVIGLFVLSMLSFGLFLSRIKKEYVVTFYDNRTGSQFLCDNWRNGTSDKERYYVFSKHPSLYKSINKELKDWLSENWERWEEEKEDWFTAKLIGKIPSELLPEKFVGELGGIKKARISIRKSVLKEGKEEVVERARRASVDQVVPSG